MWNELGKDRLLNSFYYIIQTSCQEHSMQYEGIDVVIAGSEYVIDGDM